MLAAQKSTVLSGPRGVTRWGNEGDIGGKSVEACRCVQAPYGVLEDMQGTLLLMDLH